MGGMKMEKNCEECGKVFDVKEKKEKGFEELFEEFCNACNINIEEIGKEFKKGGASLEKYIKEIKENE